MPHTGENAHTHTHTHTHTFFYPLLGLTKPQLEVFKLRLQRLVHLFYEHVLPSRWKGDLFPLLEDAHALVLCVSCSVHLWNLVL